MCKRDNQVEVKIPDTVQFRYWKDDESYYEGPSGEIVESIFIDECLVDEILFLWSKGVKTGGCCCGHFGEIPTRGIRVLQNLESEIKKMEELGYEHDYKCELFPGRRDQFKPKSICK